MLNYETLWIIGVVAGVVLAVFLFIVGHLSAQNPFELKVDDISVYRRGDIVTDGKVVYEVRAVRAPNRIVVERRD